MKITLINGSLAHASHTYVLLEYLHELLEEKGIGAKIWDIRQKPLPYVMPEYHHDPLQTPSGLVRDFVKTIESSQGIILGSPLYHGSYSGVLKNALDSLSKDAFKNKAVGLVSNAGTRGTGAMEHLRSVIRTMYGYSLQTQIATEEEDFKEVKGSFILTNNDIKQRSIRFVAELIHLTSLLNQKGSKYG